MGTIAAIHFNSIGAIHSSYTYQYNSSTIDSHTMAGDQVIADLQLLPLPREGGWFRELRHVQTQGMSPLPGDLGPVGDTVVGSSSIYYLLKGCEKSAWHRLSVDEYWCYHRGDTIRLHLISPDEQYSTALLGSQHTLQYLVGRGTWVRAELEVPDPDQYCLVSCIAVPQFTWECYTGATEEEICQK